jgi:hypothetical protein
MVCWNKDALFIRSGLRLRVLGFRIPVPAPEREMRVKANFLQVQKSKLLSNFKNPTLDYW